MSLILGLILSGNNRNVKVFSAKGDSSGQGSPSSEGEGGKAEEKEEESDSGSSSSEGEGEEEESDSEEEESGSGSSSEGEEEEENEKEEESGSGSSSEGEEEEENEKEEDSGSGSSSEGEEEESDSEEEESEGEEEGEEENQDSGPEGHYDDGEPSNPNQKKEDDAGIGEEGVKAEDLLEELLNNSSNELIDSSSALEQALNAQANEEVADLKMYEQIWKPASTEYDQVVVASVPRSEKGQRVRAVAKALRESVRGPVSSITSSLRTKFLQARTPTELHGVRKGSALSERRIVDSFIEMKSGNRPTRPDWRREDKDDCSLACAIVLDQSGSMQNIVLDVGKAAFAVAEPLSNLGSPCLVVGPRNGGAGYKYYNFGYTPNCHRTSNVTIDVFKDWEEKISLCWERFGKVQACGSTPLEDGIQYALLQIAQRKERHRVILVVTDGSPDHEAVVRHQIRMAAEAGIQVIGIGIGSCCSEVTHLFPLHVQVPDVENLPKSLLKILDNIVFPTHAKKVNFNLAASAA